MVFRCIQWISVMLLMLIIGIFLGMNAAGSAAGIQMPTSFGAFSPKSIEMASPTDRISEDDIKVFSDRVVINVKDASWASFTDTNSMDPVLDVGTNSIEIKPSSAEDISVGDIISFRTSLADGLIIHRVVSQGIDDKGHFFITKGDNNPLADPGVRRFEDIAGVVVAVIY